MAPANTGLQQVVKLEERLTLLAWLNDRFGYRSNRELLADMKQAAEGFDATGRSFVYYRLIALGDKLQVPPDDLARYDDNIRSHLAAMNARRPEPITLRYFQHLAALYSELFLDWYFHRRAEREQPIPQQSLDLVDWERAYLDLLAYKERKRFHNLVVPRSAPRSIIEHKTAQGARLYRLVADEGVFSPASFGGAQRLQEAVTSILRKYTDDFYRIQREQWESARMVYRTLDEQDPNLSFNQPALHEGKARYIVRVRRSERELIEAIEKLRADMETLARTGFANPPRLQFDRHLYQPLLLEAAGIVGSAPPALNPGEAQFVRDLKDYWEQEKDASLAGWQVFVLRNLSKGRGIGFFEERGFYPDFILWLVQGQRQRIVFVEPHGMVHADAYEHDEKARLHEALPALAQDIAARSARQHITLDSYIISLTPYDDLRKRYEGTWDRPRFAAAHILFMERHGEYDYLARLFADQMTAQDDK